MGRVAKSGVNTFVKSFLQGSAVNQNVSWSLLNDGKSSNMYNIYQLVSQNFIGNTHCD